MCCLDKTAMAGDEGTSKTPYERASVISKVFFW